MCHREESPGKTEDTLERLSLSTGLGTHRGPTEGAGQSVRGKRSLVLFAKTAAPATNEWQQIDE